MFKRLKLFLLLLIFSFHSYSFSSGGLEIMAAGDMIYDQGLNQASAAQDKLVMRGAEVGLFAPIDHQFEGYLNIAAHDESGETNVELHELVISTSKLIPRTTLKAGQFFLGLGRLNRFHQHDWPFIRAPKVHETFFAEEAVFDTGIEATHIIPTEIPLTLTLGLTSGRRWGHAHSDGPVPQIPTHYSRLSIFTPFSTKSGMDIGLNYLGRKDSNENRYHLTGIDLTIKQRKARYVSYLLQSEFWYQSIEASNSSMTEQAGLYIFNKIAMNQNINFGARLDMYKDFTTTNAISGKKLNNISYGGTVQSTYISSEFARFTAALAHEFTREEGLTHSRDTRFQLQLTFIMGSHPAHDF
jgi:hypothetical protein